MKDKDIINAVLKEKNWTRVKLAGEAGMEKSNLSGYLNRGSSSMRCDTFVRMMNAMGYDVICKERFSPRSKEYILSFEDASVPTESPKKKNLMRHEELLQNYSPSCFRTVLSGVESTAMDSRYYAYKTKADWLTLFMEAIEDLNAGNYINGAAKKNSTDYWYEQIKLVTEFVPKENKS